MINIYQKLPISSHGYCRYTPTCSEYMKQAIQRFGVIKGLKLIIGDKKIILREEFLEFHFNIFWIMPDFQIEHFKRELPLMWGIKKI